MDGNLVRRVGFAVIAIPLALALIWYGGLPLALVLALVAVKLLIEDIYKIGLVATLLIVAAAFAVGIIASIVADKRDPESVAKREERGQRTTSSGPADGSGGDAEAEETETPAGSA